jgi:hypothetical protein
VLVKGFVAGQGVLDPVALIVVISIAARPVIHQI